MAQRKYFTFYDSIAELIEQLPEALQLQMYRAVVRFSLTHTEPNFAEREANLCWSILRPRLEVNWNRYINGCKGGEFGRLGGAPKGNLNAKIRPQNDPKTTPNITLNEQNITPKQPQNNPKNFVKYNKNNPKTTPNITLNTTPKQPQNNPKNFVNHAAANPPIYSELMQNNPESFVKCEENNPHVCARAFVVVDNIENNNIEFNNTITTTIDARAQNFLLNPETANKLFADQIWLECVCMRHHISQQALAERFKEFQQCCITRGQTQHSDLKQIKQHFDNWLNSTETYNAKAKQLTNSALSTPEQRTAALVDFYASRGYDTSLLTGQ